MEPDTVVVVAHFAIHKGRRDDFEQAAREATALVESGEPDGLAYQCHVADDGTSAVIYEVWGSAEGLSAHLRGMVGTKMLPRLLAAAEMTYVDFIGPTTTDLMALVEGLPVTSYGAPFIQARR